MRAKGTTKIISAEISVKSYEKLKTVLDNKRLSINKVLNQFVNDTINDVVLKEKIALKEIVDNLNKVNKELVQEKLKLRLEFNDLKYKLDNAKKFFGYKIIKS